MLNKLLLLSIILSFSNAFAQTFTFEKRADGNYFKLDIFKNPYDNYLYLYKSDLFSVAQNNIDIIKVDSSGNVLQNIAIEHPFYFGINRIIPVETGFVVGASRLSPGTNTKSRMIKIDNSGTVQWSKDYNLSFSYAFQPIFYNITKNEIISIASLSPNAQDSSRFFINRTDTNGIVINTFAYKPDIIIGSNYIKTHDLIKLNNGNYASINSMGTYCCREPVILYLDSNFNILSAYRLQNSLGAIPQNFKIINKADDGFLIAGSFFESSGLPFSFLINVTSDLNQIWAFYYMSASSASGMQFSDIIQLDDGNLLLAGDYFNTSWERDILLLNINSSGNINWAKIIGINHDERFSSWVYEENEAIYIAGIADSGQIGFSADGLFLKTDIYGHTGCWSTGITYTTGNFNVSFDTISFTRMNVVVADSNIATSPVQGMSLTDICDGVVSIDEVHYKKDMAIYPNPATNELTIKFADLYSNSELKIYNLMGSVVFSEKIIYDISEFNLNVSELRNGIYMMEIKTKSGGAVKKFVVNR